MSVAYQTRVSSRAILSFPSKLSLFTMLLFSLTSKRSPTYRVFVGGELCVSFNNEVREKNANFCKGIFHLSYIVFAFPRVARITQTRKNAFKLSKLRLSPLETS